MVGMGGACVPGGLGAGLLGAAPRLDATPPGAGGPGARLCGADPLLTWGLRPGSVKGRDTHTNTHMWINEDKTMPRWGQPIAHLGFEAWFCKEQTHIQTDRQTGTPHTHTQHTHTCTHTHVDE